MKLPTLIVFLLLSFKLCAQKSIIDFKLLHGTWEAEGDKKSILFIENDTIHYIYLRSSSYSKNRFSIENEVLYNDQKVKANGGETFLVIYDNDKIESLFYLLGLGNKILSLMEFDTGQLVIYKKSKKKMDVSSLPK